MRTLLTALAVALGVAVVLAIEMAGGAAAGSFGRPSRLSPVMRITRSRYRRRRSGNADEARASALPIKLRPRIEDFAVLNGRTVPLLGLDVLSEEATAAEDGDPQGEQKDGYDLGR